MAQNLAQTLTFIKKIEDLLGISLFLVGGAVRDLLLGKTTKDYDFTTATSPDELELKIRTAGFKPYLLGKKFGTIGFKLGGDLIEITTFRHDIYEPQNRKPKVGFHTEIEHDLARRDLTINSMAISSTGQIIDLFGGQRDLEQGVIRAVGDATTRFTEDPLRMLRTVRFAGQYGFEIDSHTAEAIKANFFQLLDISKERWVMELDLILSLKDPSLSLDLLKNLGLATVILPEILCLDLDFQKLHIRENFWQITKLDVANIQPELLDQRWAALLGQCAKPVIVLNYLAQNQNTPFFGLKNLEIEVKDFVNQIKIQELLKEEFVAKISMEQALKIGRYLKFSNQRLKIITDFLGR